MNQIRRVKEVIVPDLVREGADVKLRRSFGPHVTNLYDPFLLFDHFAFNDPQEGTLRGFPMHPHRGIETVTYMLEGTVNHRDSLGNAGVISVGDVQWMTAGGGIMHEEIPHRGPEGTIYGFQLWVNLPAALKMSRPQYREVLSASIPTAESGGARVRVVAGECQKAVGPVTEIAAQPLYMDASLDPGAHFELPVPAGDTVLAYLFEGGGAFSGTKASPLSMVVFGDGDSVEAQAGDKGMRFMLMAGKPYGEPIAPYGPFVMNTADEIRQALADLRAGTFVMK